MATVRIVIVNYRTGPMVVDCLASLDAEVRRLGGIDAVVVDNLSGDDSVEVISAAIRDRGYDWAELHAAPANGGFAYGNNQAVRPALEGLSPPDYFLLLNPDTRIEPGAVEQLLDFMARHPAAGLAGAQIVSPNGVPQHSAFRFPSVTSELVHGLGFGPVTRWLSEYEPAPPIRDEEHTVDWVAGAAVIVRREVFETVGLMDEAYFLYFEEVDFCLRAYRAGWTCWYAPKARVVHIAGGATGVSVSDETVDKERRRPGYWFESRRRFYEKNHGRGTALMADLVFGSSFATWRLRRRFKGLDRAPPYLLWDLVRFNVEHALKR